MQVNTFPPTTLGIDYGRQRIGLALSYASLAEPLTILQNTENVVMEISSICAEHQVAQLVVGISEREMAVESRQFGMMLGQQLKLPVAYVDERFSSKQVHEKLQWLQGKQRRKEPIDQLAAAEILQDWLDSQSGMEQSDD